MNKHETAKSSCVTAQIYPDNKTKVNELSEVLRWFIKW